MPKSINLTCAALFLLAVMGNSSHAANYTADIHYFKLPTPQPVQTGDQIEVLELFWYGCPHCYELEPTIEKWLTNKPKNAAYVRMPAILRDTWAFHARVYFTFEAMDMEDKLHASFFDELHKRKNRIRNKEQLIPFLEANGVPKDRFFDTYDSFAVDSKVRHSQLMSGKYATTGVPTMIVDGKYRATATSAGGHEKLMDLVNFLVTKAAKERQ